VNRIYKWLKGNKEKYAGGVILTAFRKMQGKSMYWTSINSLSTTLLGLKKMMEHEACTAIYINEKLYEHTLNLYSILLNYYKNCNRTHRYRIKQLSSSCSCKKFLKFEAQFVPKPTPNFLSISKLFKQKLEQKIQSQAALSPRNVTALQSIHQTLQHTPPFLHFIQC
jgi:hypothetical protein